MIRQWLSRIWPTNSAAFRDTDRLEEPVVYELRRFERMVREASDAALRNAPADLALIRDRNLGTVFGPIVGAIVIVAMQNYLATLGAWVTVVQGVVFVVCVLLFREGIVGVIAKAIKKPL